MNEFAKLLNYENSSLVERTGDQPSAVDAVKAAVCQNINLLVNRDEDEFAPFLSTFVSAVWGLLVKLKNTTAQVGANCQCTSIDRSLIFLWKLLI